MYKMCCDTNGTMCRYYCMQNKMFTLCWITFLIWFVDLWQCAFDIVTPNEGSLMADAEVLCVADKVLQVNFRAKASESKLGYKLFWFKADPLITLLNDDLLGVRYRNKANILSNFLHVIFTKGNIRKHFKVCRQ